jgi:hypothetical protein
MKIRQVGVELFNADGRIDTDRQTDMKIIVTFRNFPSPPKDMTVTSV